MRPLVLFEFIFGLILFCERTLSRHQISNACQFLLASIYNEMCLISVTDIKMDYNDVDNDGDSFKQLLLLSAYFNMYTICVSKIRHQHRCSQKFVWPKTMILNFQRSSFF